MNLAAKVDAMCAAAIRRLHKAIDRRAGYAKGIPREMVNRSTGQLYRDRAAELRDATDGRR